MRSRYILVGGVALLMAPIAVAAAGTSQPPSAAGRMTLATFKTPGTVKWTVPSGVTKVTFTVFGASGGNAETAGTPSTLLAPGGAGGESKATFTVKPGRVFEIRVGGQGGTATQGVNGGDAGFNGGGDGWHQMGGTLAWAGGGGASDVRIGGGGDGCATTMSCSLYARVIVAGGGGAAVAEANSAGRGGAGGGLVGGSGGDGQAGGGSLVPGTGGTQTTPGFGSGLTHDAAFGQGGTGGGGGGWFGGGTGATDNGGNGYGAGAGSGYISGLALAGSFPTSSWFGNGKVTIQTA